MLLAQDLGPLRQAFEEQRFRHRRVAPTPVHNAQVALSSERVGVARTKGLTAAREPIPVEPGQVIHRAERESLLKKMQGFHKIIEKNRNIYLYQNVRIHLDEVNKLGNFLEFEAVMDEKYRNKNVEIQKVKYLMEKLEINEVDLVSESYENLMELI